MSKITIEIESNTWLRLNELASEYHNQCKIELADAIINEVLDDLEENIGAGCSFCQ